MLDEIINQAELNELAFNYIIVYIYFYIVIFFFWYGMGVKRTGQSLQINPAELVLCVWLSYLRSHGSS